MKGRVHKIPGESGAVSHASVNNQLKATRGLLHLGGLFGGFKLSMSNTEESGRVSHF